MLDPLLRLLAGAGNTLDLPGSMVRDALAGENPLDQIPTFWRDDNRVSGRELLQRRLGVDSGVGGFAAEMLLDPLNLVGVGLLGKTAHAASRARAFNAAQDAARAAGAMPEEIAALTKLRTPEGPIPHYTFRPSSAQAETPPELLAMFDEGADLGNQGAAYPLRLKGEPLYGQEPAGMFLDVRNPLDMRTKATPQELDRIERIAAQVRRETQDDMLFEGSDEFRRMAPDLRSAIAMLKDVSQLAAESAGKAPPGAGVDWYDVFGGLGHFSRRPFEVFRRAGYDALLNHPDYPDSTVLLHRGLAYAPQVARSPRAEPSASPLLAMLLGYNTAMAPERGG